MTFGKCFIADLFCGSGKNGVEKGSPLVLIDNLNYILSSPLLKVKIALKVEIIFNDVNEDNVNNLISDLKNIEYNKSIIDIKIQNKQFEEILPELLQNIGRKTIPKFFFLDPFSYSDVKMNHLIRLMALENAEILLFIPIFHSYRFSSIHFDEDHKTRVFVEEFTDEGVKDYIDINDFLFSVRNKIMKEVKTPYVRPLLLDGGGCKNSLLLLTNHIKGMLLMNKIADKITEDGNRINVKSIGLPMIFNKEESSIFYRNYREKLIGFLQDKVNSNKDIIDFTIQNLFLPKHAKQELKLLYEQNKIKVFDVENREINDIRKWNIAEDISKDTFFKWIADENT